MKQPQWLREFGEEYNVPECITAHPFLIDQSWHNDICPSFSVARAGERVRLWADHPAKDKREVKESTRFAVSVYDADGNHVKDTYYGDASGDAIDAALNAAREIVGLLNPRFVLNVGAIHEVFPDMPEQSGKLMLWDRQEKRAVVTVGEDYAQALCLETTQPLDYPFTALERWFNSLSNEAMESENITPTKPEYDRHP